MSNEKGKKVHPNGGNHKVEPDHARLAAMCPATLLISKTRKPGKGKQTAQDKPTKRTRQV